MAAYRLVYDSRHLQTAKNRDQLRNPTLGNRVRATFTFTLANSVAKLCDKCAVRDWSPLEGLRNIQQLLTLRPA